MLTAMSAEGLSLRIQSQDERRARNAGCSLLVPDVTCLLIISAPTQTLSITISDSFCLASSSCAPLLPLFPPPLLLLFVSEKLVTRTQTKMCSSAFKLLILLQIRVLRCDFYDGFGSEHLKGDRGPPGLPGPPGPKVSSLKLPYSPLIFRLSCIRRASVWFQHLFPIRGSTTTLQFPARIVDAI